MAERLVVALGGNAIWPTGRPPDWDSQTRMLAVTAESLASLIEAGHEVVITHGNGPQVGALLMQQEQAGEPGTALPLHALGAATQGWMGYAVARALDNALRSRHVARPVAALVTQVAVDPGDPAFTHPTKPIGPWLNRDRAAALTRRGIPVMEEADRGWRRVVPSPTPQAILEATALAALLAAGVVVVVAGGGGIPVAPTAAGFEGLDAVVDKDASAALVAREVGATTLVLLTEAEGVFLRWGTPAATLLRRLTLAEADALSASGEFPAGSMGPKIAAARTFLRNGGQRVLIGRLDRLPELLAESAGTVILP